MPTTLRSIRVLLVEDSEEDAELNIVALRKAGFAPYFERVESESEMVTALERSAWDIVLCDYALPAFNAPSALELVRTRGFDVPFVVVSGTVGEEAAIEVMRCGAHDYLFKGRLPRLGAVVERELQSIVARRANREMEKSLRLSEVRHRLLVEQSSDLVVIVDGRGRLTYVSPASQRLLEYSPEELGGAAAITIVEAESVPKLREALGRANSAPGDPVTLELDLVRRDGAKRAVEMVLIDCSSNPAIGGVIATSRDISQRVAVERERQARERAELANKTKSRLLANMSHELRTPLNAIIGFSELMDQGLAGPLTGRQSSYVANVLSAGRHLLNLVSDILDLAKVEAGKLTLTREWTDLHAIVDALQGTFRPLARARGVRLDVSIPGDLPALYADPLRLRQILYNLVSNGIKFTQAGGSVCVSATYSGWRLRLCVADTGIGIRSEDLPRLFRDFEQLETPEMSEKPEGTGLGLALTKRLVELHGGRIDVESRLGEGSAFSVHLPHVVKPSLQPEGPPSVGRSSPSTALVVEVDDSAAEVLAGHFRGLGMESIRARTAADALMLAAQRQPELITLEILIPEIDGWAILDCLREDPTTRDIPVVVVSVNDDRAQSRDRGAVAHLVKPVTRVQLQEVVHRLVPNLVGAMPDAAVTPVMR